MSYNASKGEGWDWVLIACFHNMRSATLYKFTISEVVAYWHELIWYCSRLRAMYCLQ